MEVVVTAAAEEGQVAAGFEAALAVTALGAGEALETSRILFLELVGGGEDVSYWCPYSQTQDILEILGILLRSMPVLQETCPVLLYQGTFNG